MSWSRPEYARIATLIGERTGLAFPAARRRDVEEALGRALTHGATDADRLRDLLADNTAARDELIAELTIGETYFFRDPEQFQLLREDIIPSLAELRGDAPLRMWSAGCASGEEPYSLAILAGELELSGRTHVVGTDISRVRLAAAQRGVYTKWSLRGVRDDVVDRCFSRAGKTFTLRPDLRERVDFRYLNLAEDRYPSLATGIWGFDVILCRNVLIYFDRDTVARVAQRLIESLSEDGWLLLGASDPAIGEMVDCDVVLTRGGLAYRRRGRGTDGLHAAVSVHTGAQPWIDAPQSAWTPAGAGGTAPTTTSSASSEWWSLADDAVLASGDAPVHVREPVHEPAGHEANGATESRAAPAADAQAPDVPDAVRAAYAAHDYARTAELATRHIATHDTPALRAVQIRALANLGDLEAAGRAVASALDVHRTSAELLYLHAVLLAEAERHRDAAAAARRALYLDRSLVVAHTALAAAQRRTGDASGARRSLRTAEALLAALDPATPVHCADGETAGRLLANVQAQLRLAGAGSAA